jgi:Domain of unknown function (DUF4424)
MIFASRQAAAAFLVASIVSLDFLQGMSPACANDSAAAMAAGGLELVKNDQVRMVSEVLRIAPRLVEVNYVFENAGNADVTTEVAFPLPDLDQMVNNNSPLSIAFDGQANFVGFQVWIDGREVHPEMEVRAFTQDGRDVTAGLKRIGVDPVKPISDESRSGVALRDLGVAEVDGRHILPTWTTRVSFHWSQTFPAGKQVTVRHRYRPVYGAFFMSSGSGDNQGLAELGDKGQAWCPDAGFAAAERRLLTKQLEAARAVNPPVQKLTFYDNVQYVLKTGANWRGPIGRFELQVDKGGAELVSTCPIPGLSLQRTPYGFSAMAADYSPTSDLDILFVSSKFLGAPDGSKPPEMAPATSVPAAK